MAGLLDIFNSDEGRLGLGLLAAAGPSQMGFGERLQSVMSGMDAHKANKMRMGLLQSQMDENAAQAQARRLAAQREQEALERARRIQSAAPGLLGGGGMTGGAAVPQELGGVPMFSQPMGVSPMQAAPGGFDVQGALRLGMTPKEIAEYAGLQDIGKAEVARTVEVDDGRGGKATMQFDKFGRPVGQALPGYIAPVQVNQGGQITFRRPQEGVSLPVSMSPAERDASARGWATVNQGAERLRLDAQNAGAGRAPAGYRFKADGSLEAIPGGPADKQAAASADERKAATLLQRLEGSQKQLQDALKDNPNAAKPELLASGLRTIGAEAAANTVSGGARQRVDAAQLDILDAALTLGTGAAYTREQLEGYRKSYFPQIGDDPQTVKDKQVRLQNVIQAARIAAGRAGGSAPQQSGGATGGWSIQKVN
jgi:hypothetical protein